MNDKITYNITEVDERVKIIIKEGTLANFIHEEFDKIITHSNDAWTTLEWNGSNLEIPPSTAWTFDIMITGATKYAVKKWGYIIKGLITRDNAGNLTIDYGDRETIYQTDISFSAQVVINSTYIAIQVRDANLGGDTVSWRAVMNATPVTYE